jgi:hypothetical protein
MRISAWKSRIIYGVAWMALIALWWGCAAQNAGTPTPNVPEPPQVTVLRLDQALSDATNIAANTLNVLWQNGKVDAGTAAQVKKYLSAAVDASNAIADEAKSGDSWPVMRVKIAGIAATVTTAATVGDQQLSQNIIALQGVITQILGVK